MQFLCQVRNDTPLKLIFQRRHAGMERSRAVEHEVVVRHQGELSQAESNASAAVKPVAAVAKSVDGHHVTRFYNHSVNGGFAVAHLSNVRAVQGQLERAEIHDSPNTRYAAKRMERQLLVIETVRAGSAFGERVLRYGFVLQRQVRVDVKEPNRQRPAAFKVKPPLTAAVGRQRASGT